MEDSITKKRCQKSAFWLVHKTEDFEKKKHGKMDNYIFHKV